MLQLNWHYFVGPFVKDFFLKRQRESASLSNFSSFDFTDMIHKKRFRSISRKIISPLIWTLISENHGLQKSRSDSNLRKISGPANRDFFLGLHLEKKLDLYHTPEKNPGDKLKKKSMCAGPEIFLRFETDLNFSRPWFSEIKVQIKRQTVIFGNLYLSNHSFFNVWFELQFFHI